MSRGTVNKVIIIGRLGQNPEIRYMPSGIAVVNLSVATNEVYKNKNTGELSEQTEWHRVKVFGKQADTIKEYLNKGDLIYIEGKIQTRKWQDQHGVDRYTTEIQAISTQFLNSRHTESHTPIPDYVPVDVDLGIEEPKQNDQTTQKNNINQFDDVPF